MKRAVAAVLAVAALAASALVAHAATLQVNAGFLQTQSVPISIEVPDPTPTYTITVTARRFNSGSKPSQVGLVTASAAIAANQSYMISWSGGGVVSCASVGFTPPSGQSERGPGTYVAIASADFTFCAQTGSGTLTITPQAAAEGPPAESGVAESASSSNGEWESGTAAPTEPQVIRPDDIPDFVGENCRDGGWQQLATADGQPYTDEQACVDDQVRGYYAQQREGGS